MDFKNRGNPNPLLLCRGCSESGEWTAHLARGAWPAALCGVCRLVQDPADTHSNVLGI